jgi:fermentation-respiration switch protein FrsA (DUF1100 family)
LAVAWIISQNVVHPKPRQEDHDLDDFELPAEEVSFPSQDGTRLAGWFIPGPGGNRAPTMVLSHGWARSRAELLPHANFLHRAGYAVLAFDYRNRGRSEGDMVTMGLREQEDLLGALDYVATRPEVDADRIGVFGMSTGGVIAILVAAHDQRVRVLVTEAPFANHDAVMSRALRHVFHLPKFPFAYLAKVVIERRIGGSLDPVQAVLTVDRFAPRPLFVMADESDELIGSEQSVLVYEAAAHPKRFWMIEGAAHARGWQAGREEYERRVLDFLRETLPVDSPVTTRSA